MAILARSLWICSFLISFPALYAQTRILHAHNDYEKSKPLLKALKNEIYSIEIDVFLKDERLIVSHIPFALQLKPELENLYFPKIIDQLESSSQNLKIVFDIKSGKDSTCLQICRSLEKYLNPYAQRLSILFSGNYGRFNPHLFPQWDIKLDGNLLQFIESGVIPIHTGRLSCSYKAWKKIQKKFPASYLKERLEYADRNGIETRVWGAGNSKTTWLKLWESGLNTLNVDRYKKARKFLLSHI